MKDSLAQTPANGGAQTYVSISWAGAHETFQGSALSLPDGENFLRADFARTGTDLLIETPSGGHFVVANYFTFQTPPALETADGAILNADLLTHLAGPVAPNMYAQVGQLASDTLGEPIGQINESQGLVTATHADGAQVTLTLGDNIFQGDVIETGPQGNTSIVFADDTIFTLSADGRMVMDEMVYDPETESGTFSAQVVQGVFSFVSGKIAKTSPDGMTLATPTNTIGIRGSTVLGEAAQEGSANTITLINDVDGNVGELVISNGAGTMVLSQAGATTTVFSASAAPTPFTIMTPQDIQQSYGSTLTNLVKAVAQKAEADTKETARQAQKAEIESEAAQAQADQAQTQADAAQAEVAGAETQAAEAEAQAQAMKAEADALASEAEAMKLEAEALADADMAAKAAQMAAEAEATAAKAAEAEAQAEAEAVKVAEAQAQADAAQVEAQAQADVAAQAEQQAIEAQVTAVNQAQYSSMATSASVTQQEVFTQFSETGIVDPNMTVGAATQDVIQTAAATTAADNTGAVDQAAQAATADALANGATPEEAAAAGFSAAKAQAIADGATPEEIAAAEQAYNDALAAGATPDEAMQAAGAAGQQPTLNGAGQINQAGTAPPPDAGASGSVYEQTLAAGGTPAEAFQAELMAASSGNLNDPAAVAAMQAYNDALASGLSPTDAALAAKAAVIQALGDPTLTGTGPIGGTQVGNGGTLGPVGTFGTFDTTGSTGTFTGTDPYAQGPYAQGPYAQGPYALDPYAGSIIYDPALYDVLYATNTVYSGIDSTVIAPANFDETLVAPFSGGNMTGSVLNTNYYFHWGGLSTTGVSSYAISDGGGINQIAFDNLDSVSLKVTMNASLATSGSISIYNDTTLSNNTATISFSNISQFLLAPSTVAGFGLAETFTTVPGGDVQVLGGMDANQTGIVIVGSAAAETITLTDAIFTGGAAGAMVFAKGGGDTININTKQATGLEIFGGAGNLDTTSDGIPDTNVTTFSYAGITSYAAGTNGITAFMDANTFVNDRASPALFGHDLSGVGSFTGSLGDDSISITSGSYKTVSGDAGNDTINVYSGANIGTLNGGTGIDTFNIMSGTHTISDFAAGTDKITVAIGATANISIAASLTSVAADFTGQGTVVINATANVATINLSASNSNLYSFKVDNTAGTGVTAITGASGNDTLIGGSGVDTIVGGSGADTLTGGAGADVFKYNAVTDAGDTITDFASGDLLEFLNANFGGLTAGYEELAWDGSAAALSATNTAANLMVLTGSYSTGSLANAKTALALGTGIETNAFIAFNDAANGNKAVVYHITDLANGAGTDTLMVTLDNVTTDLAPIFAPGALAVV